MLANHALALVLLFTLGCSREQPSTREPATMPTPAATPVPKAYWDSVRAGANLFSRAPSTSRFGAAASLGVDFVRIAPSKWTGAGRDFLLGNADEFIGIPPEDLATLRRALDDAHASGLKVVLTTLSLPGARWRQHNDNEPDPRLWMDLSYHQQSAAFWAELATALRGHPAIAAYNLINEPFPEATRREGESMDEWSVRVQGGAADLNRLYATLIHAIREVDSTTTIILDAANHASPDAAPRLTPVDDEGVLYSFHFYEPWEHTTWRRNRGETPYPNERWNRTTLHAALDAVVRWQELHMLSSTRILLGEFGCDRRIPGVGGYLSDVTELAAEHGWHWAFYSFREEEWDGMDYELGTEPLPWHLREARERGDEVTLPRGPNPLLQVLVDAIAEVHSAR